MRSNGPLANKKVAMGGRGWPWWPVGQPPIYLKIYYRGGHPRWPFLQEWPEVARMASRVDPAAIAEEARTVRLDAVLGPPRRSVPVGDSSTPESRTLTPLIMVRIQVPQPGSRVSRVLFPDV